MSIPARFLLYPKLQRFPARTYAITFPAYARTEYDDENHASARVELELRFEQPFCVLPRNLLANHEISFRPIPGSTAVWRAASCQAGYITLQIPADNLAGARVVDGVFEVIVPDIDPPGTPLQHVIVGLDYLERRNARVDINYDDVLLRCLDGRSLGSLEVR